MKIIILGATGHVGKCLSTTLPLLGHNVICYSRSYKTIPNCHNIYDFHKAPEADIVINCIGIGTPEKIKNFLNTLMFVENEWDDQCITYIKKNTKSIYIYFSSGTANKKYQNEGEYCKIKQFIEQKHNSLDLPIWNFRLYSFFTEFIDINSSFFMASIIKTILNNTTLEITSNEISRDYINPIDLAETMVSIKKNKYSEKCMDIGSSLSVSKTEILNYFTNHYNLKIIKNAVDTNNKPDVYVPMINCSNFKTSMFTIIEESKKILEEKI